DPRPGPWRLLQGRGPKRSTSAGAFGLGQESPRRVRGAPRRRRGAQHPGAPQLGPEGPERRPRRQGRDPLAWLHGCVFRFPHRRITQRRARQLARAACSGALTATGTFVGAAEEEDREYSAEAAPRPVDMPLSPLPEVPSRDLARPRPAAIEALDRVLSRIVSEDPVIS